MYTHLVMLLRSVIIYISTALLLSSCANLEQKLPPKIYHKTFSLEAAQDPSIDKTDTDAKTTSTKDTLENNNRFRLPN